MSTEILHQITDSNLQLNQKKENSVLHLTIQKTKSKLPELKTSKIDEDVTNWQRFWQQFESAINVNVTLDNINKFTTVPL